MKATFLLPLLVLLGASFATLEAQNKIEVNSKEVKEILKKEKNIIVIDVRTPDEFKEGHVKDAQNIDIREYDAYSKIDKLNHNASYIVYCRTNRRSGMAVAYMMQKGFKTVYQMMDGFMGWAANNYAIQK